MANPIGVWGVDVGQCALKAIRLEMIDGQPTATAFDYIEHPKILSQPDADPDALTREALEKFLSRNPLGKDQVAIATPGQSGLARFVKLPPVEEKKVTEIVKFEAKQQIPFPLEEVVWDFQKIAGGETVGGFAMETEVGLFAMKRELINKYLGHFQAVGAEVHFVQMAPLALCNFATYELLKKGGPGGSDGEGVAGEGEDDTPRGKRRCVVVLDVGTDSSNLIITDAGKIIWQRPIPLGGNHFTRALTKEMKLTFAKAEHLKRNAAKSPDLAAILRGLRPVLSEFVGEVQRSLGYFTNTHRDAHVAYLVGLGSAFRLPGLQKYLSEKLSLEVRKPAKFERIQGEQVLADPTFNENILTFPIAYGLALQGLGLARLQTNLLPQEVRTERLIRAKKPAVAAAVASLLLGVGVLAFGYGVQVSAANDAAVAAAISEAESAANQAKTRDSDRQAAEAAVAETAAQVKAIVVGSDERLNWIRFNEVLVAALPRHGDGSAKYPGGNLTLPEQVGFWNFQDREGSGEAAYQKYRERLAAGVPLEKMLYEDDMAQYLAYVNVETVYPRYVADLNTFLTNAHRAAMAELAYNIADDMLEAEVEVDEATKARKPKAVEGGGWVIELRGYTYHKMGPNFLKRCLLKNLQRFDEFAQKTPGAETFKTLVPGVPDPVQGKVSHSFLGLYKPVDRAPPNQFVHLSRNRLDTLIRPAAGVGVPGADPSGMGGYPMGGSDAAGMPGPPPGSTDAGSGYGGAGAASQWRPRWVSGFGAAASGAVAASPAYARAKTRYEFFAYLIWKEPTPTDPTPEGAAADPLAAPTGGYPAPTGYPMPGM